MPDSTEIGRLTDELVRAAREAQARAYAPYSGYRVGAALRDETGRIHVGVNVENASFGATICAERAAVLAMVAAGGARITELAVVTVDGGTPCGMCLQVLAEFAYRGSRIAISNASERVGVTTLAELFPRPFISAAVERAERPDDPAR